MDQCIQQCWIQLKMWPTTSKVGVCSQPTNPLKPNQSNPILQVGLVFRSWWVELGSQKKKKKKIAMG